MKNNSYKESTDNFVYVNLFVDLILVIIFAIYGFLQSSIVSLSSSPNKNIQVKVLLLEVKDFCINNVLQNHKI